MSNPTLIIVPSRFKAGTLYAYSPSQPTTPVQFGVTRATAATRVNASGLIESVASGVPRLDYLGQSCPGLLVEPEATNQIRNNTMVGAAAGAPGTFPTNWQRVATGASLNVVSTEIIGGINFLTVRLLGTTTVNNAQIRFEQNNFIVASNGQTWSSSFYFQEIESVTAPNSITANILENTVAGAFVALGSQTITPATSIQRTSFTRTLIGGVTVERVVSSIQFNLTIGVNYDYTFRIGWPQMELGSVATSPIPTSNTALTRNADVISLTNASGFIGQTQGTLFAEVDTRVTGGALGKRIICLNDGAGNANRIEINKGANDPIEFIIVNASVNQALIATSNNQSGIFKIAAAYANNDSVLYVNGSQIGTDTSVSVPATNQINLGSRGSNDGQFNDRIRSAAIYNTRLSNDALAQLTRL